MATGNDKDMHGRKYDQLTRDGSTSAGTMGTDSTGDQRGAGGQGSQGSSQADTRTDDLLTDGTDADQRGGFTSPGNAGKVQTGMDGIGSLGKSGVGNRQSGAQPGGTASDKDEPGGTRGGNKQ